VSNGRFGIAEVTLSERWHTKAYPGEQCFRTRIGATNDFRHAVHFHELSSVFAVQPRMDIGERERRLELTMVDGVAYERVGLAARHAGSGPRLRAASSIFLRREFGVQVWAVDLWCDVSENGERIRDAGVEDGVFPLHTDARSLPFATEFFDAIVSVDSYFYYGTDDLYLNYLAWFVKPGGPIGIAGAGLVREIEGPLPQHLRQWWTQDCWLLHSESWWRGHWERTGIVDIVTSDTMPDGWQRWLDWHRIVAPDNEVEIKTLETDRGTYLGYNRLVGRRRGQSKLADHVVSLPARYVKKPLLRGKAG
jgi:SAM-dependent methyltransferase